jgi:hypothetical protein
MEKPFNIVKDKEILYLFILIQILFLLSCKKNENVLPANSVSLEYNGRVITFDDVKIEEDYLDLDAGKGLRAYGITNVLDENNFLYYVIIDIKKDAPNKYLFHKINFGTKKQLAKDFFRLELYYAELTNGFNKTNFQTSISTDASEVKGTFSGRLLSLTAPEVSVKDGKYTFYLNTVKDY